MSARASVAAVLWAGVTGAAALGALASACNALSGVDDFAVGAEEAGRMTHGETAAPDVRSSEGGSAPDAVVDGTRQPPEAGDGGGAEVGPVDDGGDAAIDAALGAEVGSGPCDGGTAIVVHSNGLGETFSDCAPLGTFDQSEAQRACEAHTGDAGACTLVTCGPTKEICGMSAADCSCWRFSGAGSGHVQGAATCPCVSATSPTWN